ncbi:MAG TPA: hypothetical protein VF765_29115 [Polyangiaceae bacterium]
MARLVRVATLLVAWAGATAAAGCGSNNSAVGGSNCGVQPTIIVPSAQACRLLEETYAQGSQNSPTCAQVCAGAGIECVLPQSYVSAVKSLNPDAGPPKDGSSAWELDCPSSPSTVTVTCETPCGG